jgi:tripartite-type tricarboxylate transporter receptor subunit TctC
MNLKKRQLVALICVAAAGLMSAYAAAKPPNFPNKQITLVVPYPPGGSTDTATRIVATELSRRIGQPVIVENRSGAGGIIGMNVVAKAAPDGHTLGVGVSGALTIWPALSQPMPYNPLTDLAPVSLIVNNPLVLASSLSFPAKTISELSAYLKMQPKGTKGVSFGSGGPGTAMHLAGAMLSSSLKGELQHVPYRGTSPAVQDLVAGQIPLAIIDAATVRDFIKQGRVRGIATTGARRSPTMPDLPTVAESGVPGFLVTSWFGILAPKGTPADIVGYLNAQIGAILAQPGVRDKFLSLGLEPATNTPEEFRELIRSETDSYRNIVTQNKIKIE